MKFSALAFDLDGTLYPDFSLIIRIIPFLLKESRLLIAMDKARTRLRKSALYEGDFYKLQARLMGEILNEEPERVLERTERLIYRGWEPCFKTIRLYPHVRETLDAFKKAGIRMGLLSDFPPEAKLKNLGIDGYWDAVVCSEQTGRLKPDPLPFTDLAKKMGLPADELLYVGNSLSYDAGGAGGAGMKTALVRAGYFRYMWKRRRYVNAADFIFHDYRQLRDYVLS